MEQISGIYKITNMLNNKAYIGQSKDIYVRWKNHKSDAFNKLSEVYNYPLYRAIRKYGIENFQFDIIERCEYSKLNERELYYIKKFNTLSGNGYNQVLPGQGGTTLTPKIIEKIILELKHNVTETTDEIGKKFNVSGRTIRDINAGRSWRQELEQYPIRPPYVSQKRNGSVSYYCVDCGQLLKTKSIRCVKCAQIESRKVKIRPSREELKESIRNLPFTKIGSNYGVSDNAIRKWCKDYGLPYTKKVINKYTDIEWNNI